MHNLKSFYAYYKILNVNNILWHIALLYRFYSLNLLYLLLYIETQLDNLKLSNATQERPFKREVRSGHKILYCFVEIKRESGCSPLAFLVSPRDLGLNTKTFA